MRKNQAVFSSARALGLSLILFFFKMFGLLTCGWWIVAVPFLVWLTILFLVLLFWMLAAVLVPLACLSAKVGMCLMWLVYHSAETPDQKPTGQTAPKSHSQ